MNRPEYNDTILPIDESIYSRLRRHGEFKLISLCCLSVWRCFERGIDDLLSKHISHLFIRDPIVIFSELVEQDDTTSTDHFEVRLHPVDVIWIAHIVNTVLQNIQSTNWQTLRFKPPPPNSSIGWRVEFRSMEVQMTDFENAAYAVFIVLLSRAIMSMNLNFYMPISKVQIASSHC